MIWLLYFYLVVVTKVNYSKAQCSIESVESDTETYGNYLTENGDSVCCGYAYKILYEYINCNGIIPTTEKKLEDLLDLPNMIGFLKNRKYDIEYIAFTRSYVPIIYVGTFINFKSITQLYLNASSVKKLQPGAFNYLQDLQTLRLDQNYLSEITKGIFNHLTNLISLNLTLNNMKTLETNSFLGLNKLEELLLSYNNLQFIDLNYFATLNNLTLLNLSHNRILNLTEILDDYNFSLENDVTIDLSFNLLKNLNFSILPPGTVNLDLQFNQIQLLLTPICSSLRNLNLNNNAVEKLNLELFNSDSLIDLVLSNNLIKTLHKNIFDNLTNLEYLNLQNNQIEYIPIGLFQTLLSLEYLNMSGNKLSEFEYGTFAGLEHVRYLDISNNSLTYIIESMFHPLSNVTHLFIDHNLLTTINPLYLSGNLKRLEYISLHNNPWICKNLLTVVTTFQNNEIIVKDGNHKKTTNVHGIACFNYNKSNKQFELTTETSNYNSSIISDYNWEKFNHFFNGGFFNTSFYKFFKNNTQFDFDHKLTNIFQKHINRTLDIAVSKLTSTFKEQEEEKFLKYLSFQPLLEKFLNSFEKGVISKMSNTQNNVLTLLVMFVIVLICLLTLITVKYFGKSFKCFAKQDPVVCIKTESNTRIELV